MNPITRSQFIKASATTIGTGMIVPHSHAANQAPNGKPHHTPRAKNVIWLFMRGGLSHMESFDPKPALNKYAGKTILETPYADVLHPDKFTDQRVVIVDDGNGKTRNKLYPMQVGSKRYGQCGVEISDWFSNIGSCADDIAFIRSMWTTDNNHGAQVQFHSGKHMLDPRAPTLGAWINYGLAPLNDKLPQFVNFGERAFDKRDGHYLGPAYDAVNLTVNPDEPLAYAKPALNVNKLHQNKGFDFVRELNELSERYHYPNDKVLQARSKSYVLAKSMQTAIPEIMNFDSESEETKKMYGLDNDVTRPFGQQLLAARRMAQKGVRVVQVMHGTGAAGSWDNHSGLKKGHSKLSKQVDLPTAGLLKDLKQRGMLEDTIVVFASEFGRTPGSQGSDGRDHHPTAFSVWMAGGGMKGGTIHGTTDELGYHAEENRHYVTDIHATILHQLGLQPNRMMAPGFQRLEKDFGQIIHDILT